MNLNYPLIIKRITLLILLNLTFCIFSYAGTVRLNPGFNGTGYQIRAYDSRGSFAESVAVQNDGRIIIGGWNSGNAGPEDFLGWRLNGNGSPDTTFDSEAK
jgi:hypothetical protein